ncbi:N-acetyltransferase [Chryseotalea sanaruensis]|uniref:N-acetyltransferase n=1 Tax=Chryseotalea sanaruensis TaxID=2482724 RepID=A0A401U581_9BACT|nr:GNAT family N-acetyltransferase [Chryseotalea sanaruensis]GCC49946.1 N-acetyltransferase [Chryseotalea sanaruensis]
MERMNLPESLESERLLFQRLRYEDAEEIFYAYASKAEATRFVSFATHKDIRDTRTYLRYAKNAWDMGLDYTYSIRLKENSQLIGSYGIVNEMGRVQFGYILSPMHWGNGYATEACLRITSLLKTQPGVYRIGSFVDQEHTASSRVLEKSGYSCEGIFKNWIRFPNQDNQDNQAKDCKVYVLL